MNKHNGMSALERKKKVFQLAADGMKRVDIAREVGCSRGRVTQILSENEQPNFEEERTGSARVMEARARLLELQGIALRRKLDIEAGKLLRAENLDRILETFLRHFEAQTDWIRSNRTGDHELLQAHLSSVKGAAREIKAARITEGYGIDEA